MNIDRVVDEFLLYCDVERRFSKNTVKAYKSDLGQFVGFYSSNDIKRLLTVSVIKEYLAHMFGEERLSTSTARRRIACLRTFCAFLVDRHSLKDPFLEWSPSLKLPKRLPRALASQDVRALITFEEKKTEIEIDTIFSILLIGSTGLRVSELCSIRVNDISADGTSIHVLGKGARDRIVYVSNSEIRSNLKARRLVQLEIYGEASFLLLNKRNAPLQPQTLRRRLHLLRKKVGLQKIVTPHMLRHTAATLLIEAGTDIRFVQRLLGHASIATTEIYTHVSDVSLKRAIDKADAISLVTAQGQHFDH